MVSFLSGQDAYFLESSQIRGFLNPALTGLDGSLSFRIIAKNQYLKRSDFVTGGWSLEESFPCLKVDAGLYHIVDREGDGMLTTNHVGGNFVYTLPWNKRRIPHNIRIGMRVQWTHKYIDWSRLYFSDQIDPKYNLRDALGATNVSDFVPPEWNASSQLTVGLGVVYRGKFWDDKGPSVTMGVGVENYTNAFEDQGYDSLLKLVNQKDYTVDKITLYIAPEFELSKGAMPHVGLRPSLVLLAQQNLYNFQVGTEVNYKRAYGLGVYFNSGGGERFLKDTKSIVFSTFLRVKTTPLHQFNVGMQYSHYIGGLSSVFGQTAQITIGYVFKKDGCSSTPTSISDCTSFDKRSNVLYDNIW